jgi:hypothetical protein
MNETFPNKTESVSTINQVKQKYTVDKWIAFIYVVSLTITFFDKNLHPTLSYFIICFSLIAGLDFAVVMFQIGHNINNSLLRVCLYLAGLFGGTAIIYIAITISLGQAFRYGGFLPW